jgi:transposase
MADELSEFEAKLLKWLVKSDFHIQPWSTKEAAKAFKVSEDDIYDAVAALSKKASDRVQIFYKDGSLHIAAD